MEDIFVEDWRFATGDTSHGAETWPDAAADSLCRGISDGPNHDFEKLLWVIVGAISSARKSVRIMTPYFLPDWTLISALTAAAFRGVAVDIVLPRKNNLPYVAWATQAILWQLLRYGIRVHYQPPPFAHTKYLLVDSGYALVGSSNLDPRSLRLNFEFNLEIYDEAFVERLGRHFEEGSLLRLAHAYDRSRAA